MDDAPATHQLNRTLRHRCRSTDRRVDAEGKLRDQKDLDATSQSGDASGPQSYGAPFCWPCQSLKSAMNSIPARKPPVQLTSTRSCRRR